MNILHQHQISRRTFLRGTGVALGLPWLESMSGLSRAASTAGGIAEGERPRRSIFCYWGLGINGRDFTPVDTGLNYPATKILQPLDRLREEFTIISGMTLTHGGGHEGDRSFLTGCSTHTADAKLRISCDQELAEAIGKQTRFPSLTLGIRRGTGFGNAQDNGTSWTRGAAPIPAENRPHIIFDKLFRAESPEEIKARESGVGRTGSVLDAVREEAKQLNAKLGKDDQHKLDEYFSSVRDVETRMATDLEWLHKPQALRGPHRLRQRSAGAGPHLARRPAV